MRRGWILFAIAVCTSPAAAQPFVMEPGPKSPAESFKCIQVRPGFTVELMAAEPLVMDPIAFAWGPDGKFWVVEMGDYPLGAGGKNKPGGRVKFLEKTGKPARGNGRENPRVANPPVANPPVAPNPPVATGGLTGDAPYDKATVFLDGLGYPTGVTPWGKGVIITCAPDILYAEDTNGDGKADKRIVLFTGFREGNQQHRVNGLVWGLDNWLYGANGDSGGIIPAVNALARQPDGSMKAVPPLKKGGQGGVNISGRDFRLKPDTGQFEAVTGQTQFGRSRDDWGNWFGNNNSNPLFHFVLEDRYLKRNPHVLYPDPRVNVSVTPGASPVYPISKPLPRFNDSARLNHLTSACSAIIYRDDLFGPEFYGNSFVSEPVHNLIHREIVKPKGVTFTSRRADDEKESEFLASTDNWFRPATIAVGPDGALWIADMYRYVIEHPEWIPQDWQKKLDLRAGHDKGRIYRVYPKDKKPRGIVRMDTLKTRELAAALESPSGWVRDTAHTLLLERRSAENTADLTVLVADRAKPALARVHGMYALQQLDGTIFWSLAPALLDDMHAEVRRHAAALCDRAAMRDAELARTTSGRIIDALRKGIGDSSPVVRMQIAYTLGDVSVGKELGKLVLDNAEDRYIAAAALSGVSTQSWKDFFDAVVRRPLIPESVLPSLVRLATAFGQPRDVAMLMAAQLASLQTRPMSERMAQLSALLDVVEQGRSSLANLAEATGNRDLVRAADNVFAAARKVVSDPKAALGDKLLAIRLLGRGADHIDEDRRLLSAVVTPQTPEDIQAAAIQRLGGIRDPRVADQLVGHWKGLSPSLRIHVMDVLLSRIEWTRLTIDALVQKRILPQEVDAVRRQRLLNDPDAEIRRSAAKIFAASSDPDRAKLVSRYWIALPPQGDSTRGGKHFAKHCAACHQLGGIGQQVGPELASVGDKSPEGLLSAILDPNRAVEARYVNYLATTSAGVTVSGLLQGETSTTITLVAADGKKHDLLRKDIDELASTGKSVMPEGFEKELPPADMADLIAFLRGHLAKPKSFAGNRPETVKAAADGTLRLTAASAAIFGKTLVFEEKHQNLGYWSSTDDQAVWTVEAPKDGRYEVWLDFACDPSAAGNMLAVQAADAKLTHQVRSTASWDLYRQTKIGVLRLPAGRHDVIVRPEGTINGALIDLRAIELKAAE
jgi:putative membrane-bound dehydrogenase-like protein